MKNLLVIFFTCFFGVSVTAQETARDSTAQSAPLQQPDRSTSQNLLDEPVSHAIHGVVLMKFAKVGPEQTGSLIIGGELGWVLNKKYLLGLGFNGLSTVVKAPNVFPVEGLILVNNYAGLLLGYIHNSHQLLHAEAQCLIGIGQALYRDPDYRANYDQNDAYIMIEPAVNAVLNVTSGFRLAAGLSYRFANRVDLIGLQNNDLSGFSLNVSFKIGRF